MRNLLIACCIALVPLTLSACSTIPVATLAHLAPLSPLEANPDDIRVALLAPSDLMLHPGDAVLTVDWQLGGKPKQTRSFALALTSAPAPAPELQASLKPQQKLTLLNLVESDVTALRAIQADMRAAKAAGLHGKGGFSVGFQNACWNGVFPSDGRAMPFEPFIQTQKGGQFYPLFSGMDVRDLLKIAKLSALPNCNDATTRRKPVVAVN